MTGRYSLNFPEPRQRDGWFRIGPVDVTTTALMVGLGVVSMFVYAASKSWFMKLVFHPIWVRDGDIWRLVTWPIANPPDSIFVIITLVFFWFFGHRIEEMVGRVRFTWLVLVATVLPAAIVTLIGRFEASTSLEVGLGVLGTAMLVVFAFDAPNAPFFFNIPAWIIALIFVGINLLQYLGDRLWGTIVLELLVIATAVVMVRQYGFLDQLTFIPKLTGGKAPARRGGSRSRGRGRPRQRQGRDFDRVVSGPWTGPSPADQHEMDQLLDKMNSVGLSDAERKRLSELGRRLRGNG
ncbi:MAG: rhomboid family intramembrane serine protease [Ilumatobacteraceae bacterium]